MDAMPCFLRVCDNLPICGNSAPENVLDSNGGVCDECCGRYGGRVGMQQGGDCMLCHSQTDDKLLLSYECGERICVGCFRARCVPPRRIVVDAVEYGFSASSSRKRKAREGDTLEKWRRNGTRRAAEYNDAQAAADRAWDAEVEARRGAEPVCPRCQSAHGLLVALAAAWSF